MKIKSDKKVVTITFSAPEEVMENLEYLSKKYEVSKSSLLRQLIEDAMEQDRKGMIENEK